MGPKMLLASCSLWFYTWPAVTSAVIGHRYSHCMWRVVTTFYRTVLSGIASLPVPIPSVVKASLMFAYLFNVRSSFRFLIILPAYLLRCLYTFDPVRPKNR